MIEKKQTKSKQCKQVFLACNFRVYRYRKKHLEFRKMRLYQLVTNTQHFSYCMNKFSQRQVKYSPLKKYAYINDKIKLLRKIKFILTKMNKVNARVTYKQTFSLIFTREFSIFMISFSVRISEFLRQFQSGKYLQIAIAIEQLQITTAKRFDTSNNSQTHQLFKNSQDFSITAWLHEIVSYVLLSFSFLTLLIYRCIMGIMTMKWLILLL